MNFNEIVTVHSLCLHTASSLHTRRAKLPFRSIEAGRIPPPPAGACWPDHRRWAADGSLPVSACSVLYV
jgi:hypothetical protein